MRKNIGLYIVDILFKILSIIGFGSIIAVILAPYISPVSSPAIQIIGLLAPVVIIYNVVVGLYWLIRLSSFVFFAILTLLLCFIPASKLYRLDLKNLAATEERGTRIVSYNVMHFTDREYKQKGDKTLKDIAALRPDILCFQEFSTTGSNSISKVNKQLWRLKYRRVHYVKKFTRNSGIGIAVYSRFPIVGHKYISFEGGMNSAMWVDVKIKLDTIRVFNLHLQSTNITNEERLMFSDKDILSSFDWNKDADKLDVIGSRISANNVIRASQAEEIKKYITTSPYKVIVCGDFNDTPNSYTYGVLKDDLMDSFLESGKGYGHTFKGFFSMLRIDYILCDESFSVVNYKIGESDFSDHYPVIVELNLNL